MSASIDIVTPNQVLQAIEYAKSQDANDKFGDKAFRVNLEKARPTGKTTYIPFEVLKKRPDGKWDYVSLNLKFKDLTTRKNNLHPNDPKREKKTFTDKSHSLQFLGSDTCKTTVKNAKGDIIIHIEEYGRAKIAIYKAFNRLIKAGLANRKINHNKTNICSTIQFSRAGEKINSPPVKLDDPIIRVDIPFSKEKNTDIIKLDTKPKCDIYDATKKIAPGDSRYNPKGWNYEKATVEINGVNTELNYENLGEFVRAGSIVSGVDKMDSVCLSASGISLPSKLLLAVIIPGKGFKVDPSAIFSEDEREDFGNNNVEFSAEEIDLTKAPESGPEGAENNEILDEIVNEIDQGFNTQTDLDD